MQINRQSRATPSSLRASHLAMALGRISDLSALAVLLPHQSSAFTPRSLSRAARTPPSGTCPRQQQHLCSRRHGAAAAAAPAGLFDRGGGASRALGGVAGGRRRRRQHQGSSKLNMLDPGTAVAALSTAVAAGGGGGGDAAVSAWSVTSITSDFAAELFQASLFPYLAFLWLLSRKETKTPEGGTFGFAFLLVFVVATIPAGIYGEHVRFFLFVLPHSAARYTPKCLWFMVGVSCGARICVVGVGAFEHR